MLGRFGWTMVMLLSHWRRRPFQLVVMILGLGVATALWSGVQAINEQARNSYDRAAGVLGADRFATIRPARGTTLSLDDYVTLRRAGWLVSPVLEGRLALGRRSAQILGIDPVTLPQGAGAVSLAGGDDDLQGFTQPPYQIRGAEQTLTSLDLPEGPAAQADPNVPPGVLVMDIALAASLLQQPDRLTRLIVDEIQLPDRPPVDTLTDGRLTLAPPEEDGDLARLTDSFHLNLTSFGFLSFVVGLFIVHGAVGLAFEQRRATIRTLRATGVPLREVIVALSVELLVIALVAGVVGILLGYVIASALLPGVAATLRGLYGAGVEGELALSPVWWVLGMGMCLLGAAMASVASFWRLSAMPILAPARPEAWRAEARRMHRRQTALGLMLWLCAGGFLVFGDGLAAGFAVIGGLLMGAALLLPVTLAGLIGLCQSRARGAVAEWLFADARQQLGGLSLALMALLLALAVNIGVGTMVNSFRATFLGWLDQRLAAEFYLTARDGDTADRLRTDLAAEPRITAVLPSWKAELTHAGWPLELYGFVDHPTYRDSWPMIDALPTVWDSVAAGESALISEQMARRLDLWPGDPLVLPTESGTAAFTVAGVYSDFGNPRHQALVSLDRLQEGWTRLDRRRFGLRVAASDVDAVAADLRARLGPGEAQIAEQARVKAFSRDVFENTFAVTLALNALTFVVAGIAILTSLLTLSAARLPQLAPLWAMGLTRAQLAGLELMRAAALALMTALLAVPLGLALAWVLTHVVNVRAFGWQLPVFWFPADWAALVALAVATALAAAALPAWHLRRTSASALLKVFADER